MKLLKNPIFIGLLLVVSGCIIGAIGWDKNDSTIADRTHGAVFLMIAGSAMAVAGIVIWFVAGNRK